MSVEPIKVVHLDHSGLPGGGQLGLLRFVAQKQLRQVHRVFLLRGGPIVDSIRNCGGEVSVADLADDGLFSLITHRKEIEAHLHDGSPDFVLANSLRGAVALALTKKHCVWAYYIRQDMSPQSMGRLQRIIFLVFLARRFDVLIANSQWTLLTAPAWLRKRRYTAVAPPLSGIAEFIEIDRTKPRDARTVRIAWLGRLAEWKGLHVLLDALEMLHGDHLAFEVKVAGGAYYTSNDYVDMLKTRAVEAPFSIEFLGHVDDVPRFLAGQDVLVHTSINPEPFGQVIVQGMAAGLPVVATRAGGAAEIITDGLNGKLVTPGDAQELAEVLRLLMRQNDLRLRLGEAARCTAKEMYRDETLASHLEEAIEMGARRVRQKGR